MAYTLTATKLFKWDMAHMLDGHEGLCKNLHGHTYQMEVTIARIKNHPDGYPVVTKGPAAGMVTDFKDLKNFIQDVLIDKLDHALMINVNSQDAFELQIYQAARDNDKKVFPVEYRPTAENMATDFFHVLNCGLQCNESSFRIVHIRLFETPTSWVDIKGEI